MDAANDHHIAGVIIVGVGVPLTVLGTLLLSGLTSDLGKTTTKTVLPLFLPKPVQSARIRMPSSYSNLPRRYSVFPGYGRG